MKQTIILFLLICSAFCCFAEKDTIVNRKHYDHVEYYPDGKLKVLGNHNDSLKNGNWIYFKKDGERLAYGKYRKGLKKGKWIYYHKKGRTIINWRNHKPNEKIDLDENGELVIYDSILRVPCMWSYKNGKVVSIARF